MGQYSKAAWRHIRRVPYQALAAIFIMTTTFFVATIIAVLAYASSQTLRYFETRPQVIAFLRDDATPEQVSALQRQLEADARVKGVRYVSKEQALDIYKKATADNPVLAELVSPRVFPASIEFSVVDLSFAQELISELETNTIVGKDGVVFTASLGDGRETGTVITNLRNIINYIKIGGISLLSFLVASSLLILLVIIGMRIASKREEIDVLKLLGATSGFIIMPFVIEGVIYAVFGAFIGWLLGALAVLYAAPSLVSYFGEIQIFPLETERFFLLLGQILGGELLLAVLLGIVGSFVALGRYLKI